MAHPNSWEDWEDWQDWGEPNRYGYYGLNCKNRPSGTGTTHSNRREQRRSLQWENLTKATPDTEESLASQAAALEKAAAKAKKKLEEMKKKKEEEEEEDEDDDMSSSSKSNVNYRKGKKKKPRPGGALEKVPESALGKADSTIRRGRRAKHGQKELLLEESPLEKGHKTKQEQDEPLEKDPKAPKKSLEKDCKGGSAQPAAKSLEKDSKADSAEPASGSLEKDPKGVCLKPASKNPPKAKLVAAKPLEKGKKHKAICVVDWHNTLEIKDQVPESHIQALRQLCKECHQVHIVSYVESAKREKQVTQDAWDFLPRDLYHQVQVHCTYQRTGPGGKFNSCLNLGATVIFDDSTEVAKECMQNGLMVYAICTKWCKHGDLPQSLVFNNFAEAVEAYLDI